MVSDKFKLEKKILPKVISGELSSFDETYEKILTEFNNSTDNDYWKWVAYNLWKNKIAYLSKPNEFQLKVLKEYLMNKL